MLKSLSVKMVSIVTIATALRSNFRPFDISLARDEVVLVHGLRGHFTLANTDIDNTWAWALIQKNERPLESSVATFGNINIRDEDSDILLRGMWRSPPNASAGAAQADALNIWLPIPIVIPRSPSMEIRRDGGTNNLTLSFELYYTKEKVKDQELLGLLKKWKGRKQDVVSSIPRVIDE